MNRFKLFDKVYAKSTCRQYRRDVEKFLRWSTLSDKQVRALADPRRGDIVTLDELLCQFIHQLFEQGGRSGKFFGAASNTVYGLIGLVCPRAKDRLTLSSRALRGWARHKNPRKHRRPPLLRPAVFALSEWLWQEGMIPEGVAILCAFGAYLRISEVVHLKMRHVLLQNTMGEDASMRGFRIKRAKTGDEQFAPIHDPQIARVLRRYVKFREKTAGVGATANEVLFPVTAKRLRQALEQALEALDIKIPGLVFHSLRHGAATQDTLDGLPLEEVMARGRWASSKSAKIYIKQTKALAMKTVLPRRVVERGSSLHAGNSLFSIFRGAARASERSLENAS